MRVFFFLFVGTSLFANSDNNITKLDFMEKLGNFLEPILAVNTDNITHLITLFGIFMTVFITIISIIAYINFSRLSKEIGENKKIIERLETKLKKSIKQRVKTQIIYQVQDAIQRVEDDAYKKIEFAVSNIKKKVQDKLFAYQRLVFKINQVKKYQLELIINSKEEDKLKKVVEMEMQYNEINNNDIPKLFSTKVDSVLIPALEKLSEYEDIKEIVAEHMLYTIKHNGFSFSEKSKIEDILVKYYGVDKKD